MRMDQSLTRSSTEADISDSPHAGQIDMSGTGQPLRSASLLDESTLAALTPQQLAQLSQKLQQSQQMTQLNQQLLQQQGLQTPQHLQLAQLLQQNQLQQLGLPHQLQQQALQNILQPNVLQQQQQQQHQQLLQQQLMQQQLALHNAAVIQAAMQSQTPVSSRTAWTMPVTVPLQSLLTTAQPSLASTSSSSGRMPCLSQSGSLVSRGPCRGPLLQPHRASLVTPVRPWSVSGQRLSGTSQAATTVVSSASAAASQQMQQQQLQQLQQQQQLGLTSNSQSLPNLISNSVLIGSRASQPVASQAVIGQTMQSSLGLSANQNALQLASLLAAGLSPQTLQAALNQLQQHQQQLLQQQQQQSASVLGAGSQSIYYPSPTVSHGSTSLSALMGTSVAAAPSSQSLGSSVSNDAMQQLAMSYSRLPQVLTQLAMTSDTSSSSNLVQTSLQQSAPTTIPPTTVLVDSVAAAAAASAISQLIRPSLTVNPTSGGTAVPNHTSRSCDAAVVPAGPTRDLVDTAAPVYAENSAGDQQQQAHVEAVELVNMAEDDVGDVPDPEIGTETTAENDFEKCPVMVSETDSGSTVKQTARVVPQILTHIIEGFVIQEGPEPFPIQRSSFLCDSLDSSDENSDDQGDDPQNSSLHSADRSRTGGATGEEELSIKCAFCGTTVVVSKTSFRATRFCSVSCAKRCAASTRWMVYRSMHGSKGGGTARRGAAKGKAAATTAAAETAASVATTAAATAAAVTAAAASNVSGSPNKIQPAASLTSPVKSPVNQSKVTPTKSPPTVISSPSSGDSRTCQSPVQSASPRAGPSHSPGSTAGLTVAVQEEGGVSDEIVLPASLTQKHPSKWGVSDVYTFVNALPGCSVYADEFKSQEIDGQALLLLKEDHLMSALGLKLGPALKICSQIGSLRDSFN